MIFEMGKRYIVDVTEKGIILLMEFDRDRWFDKDCDDLDFLTDEEKTIVVNDVLGKIRAEIKEWYWQADKQALAKDPCVVDAMIDLFTRTIDKYKAESEDKE